jgi:ribosomal protein L32E
VFHTTQEARRVLRVIWADVERSWGQAEASTRRVEQAQRQGLDARGAAVAARHAWERAEAAFRQYERVEAGWKRAHGALAVFRPDGRLNDRAWAQEQIAVALQVLSGRQWSKVRGFLQAEGTLTFLDRLHHQLREAVPGDQLRGELVRLWWLRRQRPRANTTGDVERAGHVAHLVQQAVCHKLDVNWRESYGAVSRVLRRTVRASSAVGCMNSVLRMQHNPPTHYT